MTSGRDGRGPPTRVVIADHDGAVHSLARRAGDGRLMVVGEVATAGAAVDLAARSQPDAVVLRVTLAALQAADVFGSLRSAAPAARVVILPAGDGPRSPIETDIVLRALAGHAPAHDADGLALPRDAGAVRQARSFVGDLCRRWGCDVLVDDTTVVVSELVTNAIRHAGAAVRLQVRFGDGVVRLEVSDAVDAMPQPRRPDATGPGGRGLVLVTALSQAWGVEPQDDGKVVWAELGPPKVALPA